MNTTKPHPTETSAYWRDLARTERVFAAQDRRGRAPVESIRIHLQNADDYDKRAAQIDARAAS